MDGLLEDAFRQLGRLRADAHTALPWSDPAFSARFAERVDYQAVFGHPPAAAQVDRLIRQLGVRPGASVVDLCCGPGPHAIELARRGLVVVGVDIGPAAIALARRRAAEAGAAVTFIQSDVTDPALTPVLAQGRPAAAFLIRGQVDDLAPADLHTLVTEASRWLAAGGRLLLEFSDVASADTRQARDWRLWPAATSIWADHETLVLSEASWYRDRRLRVTRYFVLHPDGALDRYASRLQYYERAAVAGWLRAAGFGDVRFEAGDGAWTRVMGTRGA